MTRRNTLLIERISLKTTHSWEQVVAGLERGIGRPEMAALQKEMSRTISYAQYENVIQNAVGPAGLMEFLRLDLGEVLRRDSTIKHPYRMLRIIAGNPLIMKEMARHLPEAGSYAPVTILVYEQGGSVHLRYDTMESLLAPYGNPAASAVAKALDAKVIRLMTAAIAS
jgi:uncharacterized protein (DUF302 family)